MKNNKQLGVCMDHSSALIMELINNLIISTDSEYESATEIKNDANNENGHDEHQAQSNYYKKISDIIRNYDEVLLFGPTEAKNALYNLIKEDHNFENIKIEIKTTDKMNEGQMFNYIKDYFKKD